MISKYDRGIIFRLNESDDQLYLTLNNVKKDNNQYLLVMPVDDLNKLVSDYGKAFLVKVDAAENFTIEDDKELIKYVVEDTIKEENLRNKK